MLSKFELTKVHCVINYVDLGNCKSCQARMFTTDTKDSISFVAVSIYVSSPKYICLQVKRVANYETYVDELLAEGATCVSAAEHSRLMTEIRTIRQVSIHFYFAKTCKLWRTHFVSCTMLRTSVERSSCALGMFSKC